VPQELHAGADPAAEKSEFIPFLHNNNEYSLKK
jgi:hypothetical protein